MDPRPAVGDLGRRLHGAVTSGRTQTPGAPRKTPVRLQMHEVECGATALAMVLAAHGRYVPQHELRAACAVSRDGSSAVDLLGAAERYGLSARAFRRPRLALAGVATPFIAFWAGGHFVVVDHVGDDRIAINDPAVGRREYTPEAFEAAYSGVVLVMQPGEDFTPGGQPWSLRGWTLARLRGILPWIGSGALLALLSALLLLVAVLAGGSLADPGRSDGARIVVVLALAGLASVAITWAQGEAQLRAWTSFFRREVRPFVRHLLRLPVGYLGLRLPADLAMRVSSLGQAAHLVTMDLPLGSVSILAIGASVAVVTMAVDPLLGLLLGVGAALAYLLLRADARDARVAAAAEQEAQGQLMAMSIQAVQQIETLRAMGGTARAFDEWTDRQAHLLQARSGAPGSARSWDLLLPSMLGAMGAAILIVGGSGVLGGSVGIGGLVATMGLLLLSVRPAKRMARLEGAAAELGVLAAGIDDVEHEPAIQRATELTIERTTEPTVALDPPAAGHPTMGTGLRLEAVTFGYRTSASPLLQACDLELPPGSRTALLGATGSGRSTLARLCTGQLAPWSGRIITQRGTPDEGSAAAARRVGVEENVWLFAGTIRDNLTLWDPSVPDERVMHALDDAGLGSLIRSRRGGLDARIALGGRDLSGGERQRLGLARALLLEPDLLVLDDATSLVDLATEARIHARLAQSARTYLIVSQHRSAIEWCERVAILEDGRIVEQGPHDAIRGSSRYRALLGDHR